MSNNKSVLIIGSGGREHALAWAISRCPQVEKVFVAPGNGGTTWEKSDGIGLRPRAPSQNVPIATNDFHALITFAKENDIALTIVGPEEPLANGIVDAFISNRLPIFGPQQAAAQLEASKAFAKSIMDARHIPTANYMVATDAQQAIAWLQSYQRPVVVKADGLAAGKGVIVCDNAQEAINAIKSILVDGAFGTAGQKIIVEERLEGNEISVLAFCDGQTVKPMRLARDHKRAFDGDTGPNTGGMGAYAPTNDIPPSQLQEITDTILQPVIDELASRGISYVGILYAGLMMTSAGPKVLEFNCRFGDPETQVLLPLLKTNLYDVMMACIENRLYQIELEWEEKACATIVMASGGYPNAYKTGFLIHGLDKLLDFDDTIVFHAATRQQNGQIITAGGRVLNLTSIASNLNDAITIAYQRIKHLQFEGQHYRLDIGKRHMISAYARAGVNIDAGAKAVLQMKDALLATYGTQVLSDTTAFGGLYDASHLKTLNRPILVSSTDGVGTKTKVAARLGRWDTIGQDLVNHCVNDILVQGATPLFFLDYVATSQLDPHIVSTIVRGMARACQHANCALIGGETAEMPGVYQAGEVDIVGTIVGYADYEHLITGEKIQAGDVVLALLSSGLHTNGYSLARQALDQLDWEAFHPSLGMSIGEALLAIHRSYLTPITQLKSAGIAIHGLVHITGGGLFDNVPRILPKGLTMHIQRGTWAEPPIFHLIQQHGSISDNEMFRVFNMGIGMLIIISKADLAQATRILSDSAPPVGEIIKGNEQIIIEGLY